MQLINPEIYEKETQARVKAIEETRRQKHHERDLEENNIVLDYVQGLQARQKKYPTLGSGAEGSSPYVIFVHELPFHVVNNGSKLARVASE